MKPSPSNQPVSGNDINYIVLQGVEHPAIKSNHGSLANLFIHEAAGSFLPCLCSLPLFLPCRSAMCTLRSILPPKPFAAGAQHRAGYLPKMLGVPAFPGDGRVPWRCATCGPRTWAVPSHPYPSVAVGQGRDGSRCLEMSACSLPPSFPLLPLHGCKVDGSYPQGITCRLHEGNEEP